MKHFDLDDGKESPGHYACNRCADGKNILVQIGEPEGGAQTRLMLAPINALELALDLIRASSPSHDAITISDTTIDQHGAAWEVKARYNRVRVGFSDIEKNHKWMGYTAGPGGADPRAEVDMSPNDALMFGRFVLARTEQLLDAIHGNSWNL